MDYNELIEYLRIEAEYQRSFMKYTGCVDELIDAADAIENLMAERDAVIKYLREKNWCAGCVHFSSQGCANNVTSLCCDGNDNYQFCGPRKKVLKIAKTNNLLRKINAQNEAKYAYLFQKKIDMVMQLMQDAAFLAAADVFHMGPGRCEAFGIALSKYVNEIAKMMCEDQRCDKQYTYTRDKVDQRMRQIFGDKFEPWEVRYGQSKTE